MRAWIVLALASVSCAAACGDDPASVDVVVGERPPGLGRRLTRLRLTVSVVDADREDLVRMTSVPARYGADGRLSPWTEHVTPRRQADVGRQLYRFFVEGLDGTVLVVSRQTRLVFVPHTRVLLSMPLEASCAGRSCPAQMTCRDGECVDDLLPTCALLDASCEDAGGPVVDGRIGPDAPSDSGSTSDAGDAGCAPPSVECEGRCVDPRTDPDNCGVCHSSCSLAGRATVCTGGRCSCGSSGRTCSGGSDDQCCGGGDSALCTDLASDADNCGACGRHIDIASDPRNCGACLRECPPDQADECAGGACQCTGSGHACGGGPSDRCCPARGGCRNLTTDVDNCGDCGHVCSAHEHCDAGRCVCDTNYEDCDGAPGCESDRRIDASNCASCGSACRAPTPSCVDAACTACANAGDCPDDGLACTGAPQCNAGTCLHPLLPGNCLIASICYADGTIDATNRCRSCQPAASPRDWSPLTGSPCDDGLFCTDGERCSSTASCGSGTPHACDDLVACTNDSCNELRDRCDNAIDMAACYIAAACYAGTTVNPANPCQQCVPATSRTAWTPRTGTACDDGLYCTTGDACTASATCVGTARNCEETPAISCTTDTCNEAMDRCVHTTNAMRCLISGACYMDGTVNTANTCQSCQSSVSQSAWSPRTGTTCDDGLFCTVGDTCNASGMCTGTARDCEESPPLSCTVDTCNEMMDRCDHMVMSGMCVMMMMCVPC